MLIGHMRVSKADALQGADLQHQALLAAGVAGDQILEDYASGPRDERPGLDACLSAVSKGNKLVAWKLDRLGRDLRHLVDLMDDLTACGAGLRVLSGEGVAIDTTKAHGSLIPGFFAALAEFERELLVERTKAGLVSARARGRTGGRPFKMTAAKLRVARAAMGQPGTKVSELCAKLGITRQTLYRHVNPQVAVRPDGEKLLRRKRQNASPATGSAYPQA